MKAKTARSIAVDAFKADCDKFFMIELRTKHPGIIRKLKFCIRHFGLHCVAVYRFGQYTQNLSGISKYLHLPVILLHRILEFQMHLFHHVYLEGDIGPGFYIGHVGTIYIGPTKIGKNFSIHHNVTVGVGHSKGKSGVPIIGDDVWIANGSVIAGAITIGSKVTISTGSVVTRSIPDKCFAAGNPARILIKDYNNDFLFGITSKESSSPTEKDRLSPSQLEGTSSPLELESPVDA